MNDLNYGRWSLCCSLTNCGRKCDSAGVDDRGSSLPVPDSGGLGIDLTCLANAYASQLTHRSEKPSVKQRLGGTYLCTNDDYNDYLRLTVGIRDV